MTVKTVLLCVDSEGSEKQVRRILDVLNNEKIRATFFVVGQDCERNPTLYKEIAKQHQVETHTYSHPNLRKLSWQEQYRNITKGKKVVEKITGKKIKGFRAPMHMINKDTVEILNKLDFKFDVSCLYFNINTGKVAKFRPAWFCEGGGITKLVPYHWWFMKILFNIKKDRLIIPLHPQYTCYNNKNISAFKGFVSHAKSKEGVFVTFDDIL